MLLEYPETVTVRDRFFPFADEAPYAAKWEGRNCVRVRRATSGRTAS
jgi:hypothetical protein